MLQTLCKVITTVLQFSDEQTRRILEKEEINTSVSCLTNLITICIHIVERSSIFFTFHRRLPVRGSRYCGDLSTSPCQRPITLSFSIHLLTTFLAFLRGGVLVEKLFCSFFNPAISLYIYYDQYEKIWRKNQTFFFPAVGFHGNGGHIRF